MSCQRTFHHIEEIRSVKRKEAYDGNYKSVNSEKNCAHLFKIDKKTQQDSYGCLARHIIAVSPVPTSSSMTCTNLKKAG